MIFRDHHRHRGVVLLRLDNEQAASKIDAMRRVLESYSKQLVDAFVVVTETQIRFGTSKRPR